MGHRANYILIETGHTAFYTDRWGGIHIPNLTFWGPEHTVHALRQLPEVPASHLRDALWCEGAVLVNCDAHTLMFSFDFWSVEAPTLLHDGQFSDYDTFPACPVLRSCYLEMLQASWPDWQLFFAETVDFACPETLEVDPTQVRCHGIALPEKLQGFPASRKDIHLQFASLLLQDQRFDAVVAGQQVLPHFAGAQAAEDFFTGPPAAPGLRGRHLHMARVLQALHP